MRALSVGEQNRLQAAISRYQPLIQSTGVANIMRALRQALETRYTETPAKIIRDDDSELPLPYDWQAFQALNLSTIKQETQENSEYDRALQAYYQHKDHTAWRYLLKPNPWMHKQAGFVEVNPHNLRERWSTFEEYQPLITMLYLAAIDNETPPTEGYTLDTRLEHFIDELAHIGRAHNWDDTRIKMDDNGEVVLDDSGEPITEEYDNLQGDKPSCYSGVKRRLFQSVQGHPLLVLLTKEGIDAELREFVRAHFQQAINGTNREALQQAWDRFIQLESEEADIPLLKTLDISVDKQNIFIESLIRKYGEQFTEDPTFKSRINDAFMLSAQTPPAHILKFDFVGVQELLESPIPTTASVSSTGLFAKTVSDEDPNGTKDPNPQMGEDDSQKPK